MIRLTDVQRVTLTWILAFADKQKRAPSQDEIAAHFEISAGTANARVKQLVRRGLLKTRPGVGTEILPGAREALQVQPIVLPEPVDLPAEAPLSPVELAVTKAVYEANLRHEAPTCRDVARATQRQAADVYVATRHAIARGALTRTAEGQNVTLRVTALGVGFACGLVRATSARVRPVRKAKAPVRMVEARPAAPREPKPKAPPQVPSDQAPVVPPGFDPNAPRPVRHPSPPEPAERPETMPSVVWYERIRFTPCTSGRAA